MAIYNEILAGRFNRALQKLTSIKGGPPSRQIGSEIMPGWNLPLGNEFRYLEGWNRYSVLVALSTGGVGNISAARFRNLAGSNMIAVFEKIAMVNQNAAVSDYRIEGWLSTGGAAALATD